MTAAVSALGYLHGQLQQALAADGTAVHFGRREAARQIGQGQPTCNRVVIDPSSGQSAGKFAPAKYPGRNPRPVGGFVATATVYVWALDAADPNNELLQYEAVTALQARVYAAIHRALSSKVRQSRALHGWFEMSDPQWVGDKVERVRGAEWSFTLAVHEDICDLPWGEAVNVTGVAETILTGADGA
jgi:hypothetical protein